MRDLNFESITIDTISTPEEQKDRSATSRRLPARKHLSLTWTRFLELDHGHRRKAMVVMAGTDPERFNQ